MDDLVSQSLRHSKGSAIDDGSRRRRDDGFNMAGIAANTLENFMTCLGSCSRRQDCVGWRYLGAADELGKVVDIR